MERMKVTTEIEAEIDVKEDVIDKLSTREKNELAFNIFDILPAEDKVELVQDSFASLDDKSQKAVLDYIISELLTDEQFHILTKYFKKYGK